MRWRRIGIAVGLVLVLVIANLSIARYDRVVSDGRILLLELAPVDPRSIMQGDYMTLNFAVAREIDDALQARPRDAAGPRPDLAIFQVPDPQAPGTFVRLASNTDGLAADEIAFRFTQGGRGIRVGTDAFFFEEGRAGHFEQARFGEFRVDASGTAILTGLRDADGRPL